MNTKVIKVHTIIDEIEDFDKPNFDLSKLELWFQPIYHVFDGSILHNEVLLRWRSKEGQVYLPQDFFSFIVTTKHYLKLDYIIVTKVIKLLSCQRNDCFSVNLSENALKNSSLLKRIKYLNSKYKIQTNQLSFELSEGIVANNFSAASTLIYELKSMGHQVIIDKFSSQELSFDKLQQLPIDIVKIDTQLIQKAKTSTINLTFLKAIIARSNSLNHTIVTTAVNGFSNIEFLKKTGIFYIQSNHFKPPSSQIAINPKVNILGLPIDNLSKKELLQDLKYGVVFTPNVDHIVKLPKDEEFTCAYNIADYKICDSQIIFLVSKFLGTPIKEKISGSDFFPAFYNYHKDNEEVKIFLLGGASGIAAKAQEAINSKVGRDIIVDSYSPSFGFETKKDECLKIIELVNKSKATVLAIGVGAPKQEKWLYDYKKQLPSIQIFLAIGATIDFEAGNVKRAPMLFSKLGLEWLFRLISEPKRLWKRYLVDDLAFFWYILKQIAQDKLLGRK